MQGQVSHAGPGPSCRARSGMEHGPGQGPRGMGLVAWPWMGLALDAVSGTEYGTRMAPSQGTPLGHPGYTTSATAVPVHATSQSGTDKRVLWAQIRHCVTLKEHSRSF